MYQYPVIYRRSEGEIKVRFPDIPEIITSGDTLPQAKALAYDALICALGGYMHLKRPVPGASKPAKACICLSALHSAKLALYSCMLEHRISQVALADRLGVTEGAVRRLLDLDHASKIDKVEQALGVLGKRIAISVLAA